MNKNSTKNNKQFILKSFFNWLEEEEIIIKSPARKLKNIKTPKLLRKSLSLTELEKIRIACSNDRDRALIELFFATECRLSEIINLNVEDLSFNTLSIKVIGKGNKERIVYFSEKTGVYLNNYLNSRIGDNVALFTSLKKPYQRLTQRGVQDIVKRIASRINLDRSIYPHIFRHTTATLAHSSGASLTTIQSILGHSSSATTQIYAEMNEDNILNDYKKYFIH